MKKQKRTQTRWHAYSDLDLIELCLKARIAGKPDLRLEQTILQELDARGIFVEVGNEGDECSICKMIAAGEVESAWVH